LASLSAGNIGGDGSGVLLATLKAASVEGCGEGESISGTGVGLFETVWAANVEGCGDVGGMSAMEIATWVALDWIIAVEAATVPRLSEFVRATGFSRLTLAFAARLADGILFLRGGVGIAGLLTLALAAAI
jgi:hypothetical protein